MVEFVDGSVLAQLGSARHADSDRLCAGLARADGDAGAAARPGGDRAGSISKCPTLARFPALRLAREALEAGGAAPIVLNAANEVAVASFLAGENRLSRHCASRRPKPSAEPNSLRRDRSTTCSKSIAHARRDVASHDEGELPLMLPQPPLWLILIAFICALGPLVFFHELGHYLVARLLRHRRGNLFDRLRPRDCRLDRPAGNAVESRLAAARRLREVRRRHEPGEQPGRRKRHPAPNIATGRSSFGRCGSASWSCLPGPAANFLLAILIFAALFAIVGKPQTPNVVETVQPGSPAERAGLKAGDRIDSIAGEEISSFEDLQRIVGLHPGLPAVDRRSRAAAGNLPFTPRSASAPSATASAKATGSACSGSCRRIS